MVLLLLLMHIMLGDHSSYLKLCVPRTLGAAMTTQVACDTINYSRQFLEGFSLYLA